MERIRSSLRESLAHSQSMILRNTAGLIGQISVFLLYLTLRIFGLTSDSPKTSDLAFDILSCAACILFPRLVFYVIRDNVVILAVRLLSSFSSSFLPSLIARHSTSSRPSGTFSGWSDFAWLIPRSRYSPFTPPRVAVAGPLSAPSMPLTD